MTPKYDLFGSQFDWALEQPDPKWDTHFVVQRFTPGKEIVLTVGVLVPMFYGTEQDYVEQAARLEQNNIGIQTVARLVLSSPVAKDLHRVLGEQLALQETTP